MQWLAQSKGLSLSLSSSPTISYYHTILLYPTILLYIKGAEKNCLCLQSEWLILESPPIRMVPPALAFLHLAEQFVFIVLGFQEYYKEKCMSHTATPGEQLEHYT